MASKPTNYTFGHSATVTASHASRTVSNSASFVLPYLKPTMTLLDVGCGPGTITVGFSPYLPEGKVIGMDFSPSVIAEATQLAESQGLTNTTFQTGDVFALPFPDSSMDLVYCNQLFPHLPRPVEALKELRRVVKPDGLVATRDVISWNWFPALPGLLLMNAALSRMFASTGASLDLPGAQMHKWAREAGFERSKMTISAGSTVYATDEEREWWARIMDARVTKDETFRKNILESGTTEADIDAIVKDLSVWGKDEDGWYGLYQAENIYRK